MTKFNKSQDKGLSKAGVKNVYQETKHRSAICGNRSQKYSGENEYLTAKDANENQDRNAANANRQKSPVI